MECPHCNIELDVEVELWDCKTTCPKCNGKIFVECDMMRGADGDEWEIYYLKPLTEDEFIAAEHLDVIAAKKL